MRNLLRSKSGFTLLEITIVVMLLGILLGMAVSNLVKARSSTRKSMCINNLREIQSAKDQWGLENKHKETDEPSVDELASYIKGGVEKIYCPDDSEKSFTTSYMINPLNENPACQKRPDEHLYFTDTPPS